MARAKRLADLYKVGTEVTFEGHNGEEDVVVWVQKLIPPETQQALKRANVERAKVLSIKHRPAGDELREEYVVELDRSFPSKDDKILLISSEETNQARESAEMEVAADERWSKDDYLKGLQDAWEEGVGDKIAEGVEDDPEATRIWEELKKYAAEVDKNYRKREARILREFKAKSDTEVMESAFDTFIDAEATSAWLQEYRKSQIWLATREPTNHRELYFETRQEVDECAMPVLAKLLQTYAELEVSPTEGKD